MFLIQTFAGSLPTENSEKQKCKFSDIGSTWSGTDRGTSHRGDTRSDHCCLHIKQAIKEKLFISASADIINTSPEPDSPSCAAVNSTTLLATPSCPVKSSCSLKPVYISWNNPAQKMVSCSRTAGCANAYKSHAESERSILENLCELHRDPFARQ